jgi:HAD superfamily hydrolase (TIGR01450 family)
VSNLPGSSVLSRAFDLGIFDLDGVVYVGPTAVPGAAEAISAASANGLGCCYLTNNASRPAAAVAEHLTELGVPATAADVVTSAQVAAAELAERYPSGSRILVVGGAGLREALHAEQLVPVETMDDDPVAVVQGFSPDLDWRRLAEGTRAVRAGLFWVATNLDLTVPTPFGRAPGNGTLVQAVASAAGRRPDLVAGKPDPGPFRATVKRYGAERPLVIGDRLDTDIEGAVASSMPSLLVLTGVSGVAEVLAAGPQERPTYLGRDLTALNIAHPETILLERTGGQVVARCGSATATVENGAVRFDIDLAGLDGLDPLRAACLAAWEWAELTGGPVADIRSVSDAIA